MFLQMAALDRFTRCPCLSQPQIALLCIFLSISSLPHPPLICVAWIPWLSPAKSTLLRNGVRSQSIFFYFFYASLLFDQSHSVSRLLFSRGYDGHAI